CVAAGSQAVGETDPRGKVVRIDLAAGVLVAGDVCDVTEGRIGGAEVVVCDASFNLGQRREEFVAQPEVKSEAIAHLEVILRVERILPGAQAERALQGCAGDLVWKTEFQGGDGVAARPRA